MIKTEVKRKLNKVLGWVGLTRGRGGGRGGIRMTTGEVGKGRTCGLKGGNGEERKEKGGMG